MSPFKIAMLRSPAIILTLFLELVVGLVISRFKLILEKHILLTAFIPVISAVSGNIGLQASTATLRGLATGYAKSSSFIQILKVLRREVVSAMTIAVFAGIALFLISLSWSQGMIVFALVTGLSISLSASLAGALGTLSPIIFKTFNIDPAVTAGPFETAVQDIVGIGIFLTLGYLFLP